MVVNATDSVATVTATREICNTGEHTDEANHGSLKPRQDRITQEHEMLNKLKAVDNVALMTPVSEHF